MQPNKIKIIDNKFLQIIWDNDEESRIGLKLLRSLCPCATCYSEREARSKSYIPLFLSNQISVAAIEVTGNYAIRIKWEDGHNTGIYEYSFLKNLAADSVRVQIK